MIEFVKWIEIPIRVYAKFSKCPDTGQEAMGINDIEICLDGDTDGSIPAVDLKALKDSILENRNDEFVEDAWENRD